MATKPQSRKPAPPPPRQQSRSAPPQAPQRQPIPQRERDDREHHDQRGSVGGRLPATVAPREVAMPSKAVLAHMQEHSQGDGLSKRAEDNLVPIVYVLQKMSPQCEPNKDAYIEGAQAGMIWLRNWTDPLVDGEEGILVQPCHFNVCVIEWIHRDDGGGFVARHNVSHPREIDGAFEKTSERTGKKGWAVKRGDRTHQLVETREHVVLIHLGSSRVPYVIPFTSTGHGVSRGWMFTMNNKIPPGGKEAADSWYGLYRMKTKWRSNDQGDWYQLLVEDEGWVDTTDDVENGAKLHAAFKTGALQTERPDDAGDDRGEGGGSNDASDRDERI